MSEIKSEIIPLDDVGESYGDFELLNDNYLQIYRVYTELDEDYSFFEKIASNNPDITISCYFKCECNWINSEKESGFFYELFVSGDRIKVRLLFEEFLVENKLEAELTMSPFNMVKQDKLPEYLSQAIPELYYNEDGVLKGIPFILNLDLKDADIENFNKDNIKKDKFLFGWWNDDIETPVTELDINEEEKTVNGVKFK